MPTFKDSHDDNPSVCNDPAEDYKIGADTPTRSAGMNMDQLAQAISVRIGVNPPPQPTENLNQLVITIQPNTLLANLQSVTGVTYDYYAILTDDETEPTYPDDFTQGVLPQLVPISSWLVEAETKYVWVYDTVTSTKKELLDPNGVSGVEVTPVATLPPTQITDLVVTDVTATTCTATFSATTIIDGIDLTYDVIDNTTKAILATDVTPGAVAVTGLSPATDYDVAINVYPTENVEGDTTTRASISNIESITTSAIGTITGFVVDDVNDTGGPANANISTFTASAGIDEAYLSVDDSTTPAANDAGWDTIVNWLINGIDVVTYGAHTVYAWGRDGSFPTSLTPMVSDTMTATDSGGSGAVVGFSSSTLTTYEERAETQTITINRTADTTGTTTVRVTSGAGPGAIQALPDINYKSVDTFVTFAAAETSKTVSLDLLWANLGFSTASLTLTLSDVSSGDTIDTGSDTIDISIEGTYGYWSLAASEIGTRDGDIDIFNPPTIENVIPSATFNPPVLKSAGALLASNSETISGVDIDASSNIHGVQVLEGVSTVTIENAVIRNAPYDGVFVKNGKVVTLRNCFVENNGNGPVRQWEGAGCRISGAGGTDPQTIKILGNRFRNNNKATYSEYTTTTVYYNKWNYNEMGGVDAFTDALEPKLHRYYGTNQSTFTDFEMYGNTTYIPTVYANNGVQRDVINTYRTGGVSGTPAEIKYNVVYGNAPTSGRTAGLGIIISDGTTKGFWQCQYNIVVESGLTGVGTAGGDSNEVSYNDIYMSANFANKVQNAVGIYAHRINANNDAPAGTFKSATIGYNRILWYNITGAKNISWFPPTGSDGLIPNHGATAGQPNTPITNWSTNIDMESVWGNGAGDLEVKGRLHVLRQEAFDDGIYINWASYASTVGNGRLTFISGTPTATWAEYGDTAGSAVDLTGAGVSGDTGDERFELFSGNGNSIVITIHDSGSLPVSTTEYTINVTKFKLYEIQPYVGETGDWTGGGGSATADTIPPTTPTISSANPGATTPATTIDLVWTQSTDAGGMGGYFIYRDNVFVQNVPGDPASPSWTDTGLTEDVTYQYEVQAYDAAGNFSSRSLPVSGTPTAGTNLLSNGEFQDTSSWTAGNATLTVAAGVGTVTNTVGSPSGRIYQQITTSASTAYTLTIKYKGKWTAAGLRQCRLVIHSSNNNITTTDMGSGGVQTFPNANVLTETTHNFTTDVGQTSPYIILWVNSTDVGGYFEVDYARIS